jgi:hypothetical protein
MPALDSVPPIGTQIELRHDAKTTVLFTLVCEDAEAPSTHRYVLRVDLDPRGRQFGGYDIGDEMGVEDAWFTNRGSLWPRDGGARVAPPRAQIVDLFEALKQSLKTSKNGGAP